MDGDKVDLFEQILSKMNDLQLRISVINLMKKDPKSELIQQMSRKINNINSNLFAMRNGLESIKEDNNNTKRMEDGIKRYIRKLDKISPESVINEESRCNFDRIGTIITKLSNISENIESKDIEKKKENKTETQVIIRNEIIEENETEEENTNEITDNETFNCDFTVIEPQNAPTGKIKKKALLFDIDYVTEDDLKSLSKYMVNRISVQQVNNFIDKINETLYDKSELMAKKQGKLNFREKNLVQQYKSVKNIKSNYFIYDKHLLHVLEQKCLDKKSVQLIVILTHLKRIISHRDKQDMYYILL